MIIKEQEALKKHTTFRVGGPTPTYYIPESIEELQTLVQKLSREHQPYRILGNGSNLLVSDQGVDFSVIELRKQLEGIELLTGAMTALPDDGLPRLRCLAGTLLSQTAAFALSHSLTGMEGLSGIPGTVGGAVVMNAGAYGYEIKDILESVQVLTEAGELLELPAEALSLSYRHSSIEENRYILLSATFRLTPGDPQEIAARTEDFRRRRQEKQPLNYPSAGSTFRRPEGRFAGKLIEDAGMKGYRVGDAQISEKHAGFLVNVGHASAADLYQVICDVQRKVYEVTQIHLQPEVKLWGSF